MNKRGFTLVELITTFALSAVIITILTNIVLIMKNMYNNTSAKTELYINQANLSNYINSKLNNGNLLTYSTCNDSNFCYTFTFSDGTTSRLVITDNKITFGDYNYVLKSNNYVEGESFDILNTAPLSDSTLNDSIMVINIPIKSKLYPKENFGVNIVYQYNSNTLY